LVNATVRHLRDEHLNQFLFCQFAEGCLIIQLSEYCCDFSPQLVCKILTEIVHSVL
jgi:hypothetical protein